MKAAFIERTGPAHEIQYGDLPDPVPGPREALVRVRACAVNPIDTYIRGGTVAMPLTFPFIVGCDLAGEVVAVGSSVDRLRPGMRVWGSNQGVLGRQGTFAELAAVDERWLYPTPDALTDPGPLADRLCLVVAIPAWVTGGMHKHNAATHAASSAPAMRFMLVPRCNAVSVLAGYRSRQCRWCCRPQ